MPPHTQKRRRAVIHEDDDEPPAVRRQSKRQNDSEESEESGQDGEGDVDMGGPAGEEGQLAKKLVRYALACEHARIPIKRDGIREKVLGNNARSFKKVFEDAQMQLRQVFGMEMAELPVKEKRTLKEKQSMSSIALACSYMLNGF
jgi:hypothetical protein